MRIALAKVLLESPDILLLDEPTNYLDIEARSWLEEWLKNFTGGYLLVSHDRYFLDVTVNEVYELFQGTLKRYAGNYSDYEKVRETELETLMNSYKAQQEEIAKSEDLIRRFRYKPTKAAMVQERIKRLEKMERIEIPESMKKINIRFPSPPHSGKIAMTLDNIGKSYGSRQVISGLNLLLESKEKLVVVGRNGAGKSTLLRILAGVDSDYKGSMSLGAGISVGYFSQDAAETMTGTQSVLEFMEAEAPLELIPKVRDMLGAFLFRGDDVYKSLSVLSGGEKSRLALLKLLLKPMNLLILDEPTNHLDLSSKDILLDTLKAYEGTVIFVSHDRDFMEALSTKTLELTPGEHKLFYGNYAYYIGKIDASADTASVSSLTAQHLNASMQKKDTEKTQEIISGSAEFREAEKKRQAQQRKLQREEEQILKELEVLENEKQKLIDEIQKPEIYSYGEKAKAVQTQLNDVNAKINSVGEQWELIVTALEEI
jgi:ATP-binding cassette subfamily F protein 3